MFREDDRGIPQEFRNGLGSRAVQQEREACAFVGRQAPHVSVLVRDLGPDQVAHHVVLSATA